MKIDWDIVDRIADEVEAPHDFHEWVRKDLLAFSILLAQRVAEAERETCAQTAMLVAKNGIETSEAIRARTTKGEDDE